MPNMTKNIKTWINIVKGDDKNNNEGKIIIKVMIKVLLLDDNK